MKNHQRFVELLLDNGAVPNIKNRVTGMPLIQATARSGNFEVLAHITEEIRNRYVLQIMKRGQFSIGWLV